MIVESLKNILPIFFLIFGTQWVSSQTPADQLTIGEILIEGNKKTNPRIIIRELTFEVENTYTRQELDSMFVGDRNRIYNTNLFNEVKFEIVNESNGNADIKILVDERWYFYPIPFFKLVDRNFSDWWSNRNRDFNRVNYGVRVTQYNFRGKAEALRVNAQFGFNTRLNFIYRVPYIDKKQKHGLTFNFNYLKTKNLAYSTVDNIRRFASADSDLRTLIHSRIDHNYRNSFLSFHQSTIGHYHISVADTVVSLNPNYLASGTTQSFFYLRYGYLWDRRNNRNYPTSGEWYRGGITKFGLGLLDEEVDYWSISLKLTKYYDLGKNWYYAAGFNGLTSFPEERNYSNYFAVGFLGSSFRGHDLNIIEGSSYSLQLNEIKYKVFSNSYDISRLIPVQQFQTFPVSIFGKLFFDHGYVKGYPNYTGSDLLDDRYVYTYGAGIDLIIIYDTVFRLELSRNTLNETNFFINFLTYL